MLYPIALRVRRAHTISGRVAECHVSSERSACGELHQLESPRMSDTIITVAAVALLCVGGFAAYWTQARLRRATLARWAAENGFSILESSSAMLTEATPFWFTA